MDTLVNLEIICKQYIDKMFEIEEFKSRLETLLISTKQKKELEMAIFRLENIMMWNTRVKFYKYGVEVASSLLGVVQQLRTRGDE